MGPSAFEPLLCAVRSLGTLVEARIYLSEHTASLRSADVREHGLEPVIVPRVLGGMKDPADIRMALDAAAICLRPGGREVTGIVIASQDVDLALVLEQVRAWGLRAFAAVKTSTPSAAAPEYESRRLLRKASGNELVYYTAANDQRTHKAAVVDLNERHGGVKVVEVELHTPPADSDTERLKAVLTRHGYDSILVADIARFFYANHLGDLTVWPFTGTLSDACAAVARGSGFWVSNPGDLVYVEPVGPGKPTKDGSTNFNKCVGGGGPFVCRADSGLVRTVLREMGYVDDDDVLHAEGLGLFYERNRKALLKLGVPENSDSEGLEKHLDAIFRAQDLRQQWKVPPRDTNLRAHLVQMGLLSSEAAPKEVLERAMRAFLGGTADAGRMPVAYVALVARCVKQIHSNDPTLREKGKA